MTAISQNKKPRLSTIDGLRGLAALSVATYHLSTNLKVEFATWVPEFIQNIVAHGFLGVPVFFVLSGFVIALSIGKAEVTPKYIGNFILRRAIRLDPTYWASILIALTLLYGKNQFIPGSAAPYPTTGNFFAHLFYLQDLLGFPPVISAVYWTLCLEIQLYIFYIIMLGINHAISKYLKLGSTYIFNLFICVIGIYSLMLDYKLASIEIKGLFLPFWHYFLFGVIVSYVVRKQPAGAYMFFIWLIIEMLFAITQPINSFALAGLFSAAFIFFVNAAWGLNTVLSHFVFQYFGRLSYTIYLLHSDIGWKFISVSKKLIGDQFTPLLSIMVFIASFVVTIIAAHILHKLVEIPSLKFAARFKKKLAISPQP